MASLSLPAPQSLRRCKPYCGCDPIIGNVLVFFAPLAPSSSGIARIEAYVLSCAGFRAYPKITLAPTQSLYGAVNNLALEKQDSDDYRSLAVAVMAHFIDFSKEFKDILQKSSNGTLAGPRPVSFDEMHAGDLASSMREVESETLANDMSYAVAEKYMTTMEVDLVFRAQGGESEELDADRLPPEIEEMLKLFGEPTYLPFTKLKRSSSRPAVAMGSRPSGLRVEENAEALARELNELRSTEESYGFRLKDLLENVIPQLRKRTSGAQRDLDHLFPPSLEQIYRLHLGFYEDIKEGSLDHVSKAFLKWVPQFKMPYEDYILASADFPILLSKLVRDKNSSFTKRVQATGEQKVKSLVMEGVQRLPRHSLMIDNMIKMMSSENPTLARLDRAKEMLDEICALQRSEKDERTMTTRRLQAIIASWPASLRPSGRLVGAIDFLDILPPFNDNSSESIESTMLLFPDTVVLLRRPSSKSLQARAIMAEVDRPPGASINHGSGSRRNEIGHDLQFAGWVGLEHVRVSQGSNGSVAWLTIGADLKDTWDVRAGGMGIRKMWLQHAYEGRAGKLEEDIVKARLEWRCVGNKGIIATREARHEGLTIWSSIRSSEGRYVADPKKSSTAVYLDQSGTHGRLGREIAGLVGRDGIAIAVGIELAGSRKLRLEFRSWRDHSSTDIILKQDFLRTFTFRIANILRQHASSQHPPFTRALMSSNRKLLRSLRIDYDGESKARKLRPPSPVKLLGQMLGGQQGSPTKVRPLQLDRSQSTILQPTAPKTTGRLHRQNTVLGIPDEEIEDMDSSAKITMSSQSPLRKLEATMLSFITALRTVDLARADLKSLRDFTRVDNGTVDAFLQQLEANPELVQQEQNLEVNVIFAALNKFLWGKWKDGMGDVIDTKSLEELQQKNDTLHPDEFEEFFRAFMMDWAPQNKRAFKTIITLLKELQGKVQMEEDKGVLTMAVTELFVSQGHEALDYMALVDRLVEGAETLFDESQQPYPGSDTGSLNGSLKRNKSLKLSTDPSNSLRRRFGLPHNPGSSRERSNTLDSSGRLLWRGLSKASKEKDLRQHVKGTRSLDYGPDGQPLIILKPSWEDRPPSSLGTPPQLKRPASEDRPLSNLGTPPVLKRPSSDDRALSRDRPGSDDRPGSGRLRPVVLGGFTPNNPLLPPFTPSKQMPATINAAPQDVQLAPGWDPAPVRRLKRRSSLGDLTKKNGFQQLTPEEQAQLDEDPEGADSPPSHFMSKHNVSADDVSKPHSPLFSRHNSGSPASNSSPGGSGMSPQTPLSRVEGLRLPDPPSGRSSREGSLEARPMQVILERREPPPLQNSMPLPKPPLRRLKMQSPQKLRERLQHETYSRVDSGLQDELDDLGSDLNGLTPLSRSQADRIRELSSRLNDVRMQVNATAAVELQLKEREQELYRKKKELRGLDKLYRDCQAENDIMFETFNTELDKISNGFKIGGGPAELVALLKETKLEQAKMQKENMKLRRENLSLRTKLEDGSEC